MRHISTIRRRRTMLQKGLETLNEEERNKRYQQSLPSFTKIALKAKLHALEWVLGGKWKGV